MGIVRRAGLGVIVAAAAALPCGCAGPERTLRMAVARALFSSDDVAECETVRLAVMPVFEDRDVELALWRVSQAVDLRRVARLEATVWEESGATGSTLFSLDRLGGACGGGTTWDAETEVGAWEVHTPAGGLAVWHVGVPRRVPLGPDGPLADLASGPGRRGESGDFLPLRALPAGTRAVECDWRRGRRSVKVALVPRQDP